MSSPARTGITRGDRATGRESLARLAKAPLELPKLIVRRASLVVAAVFVCAAVLAVARMQRDVDDELEGALAFARLAETLVTAAQQSDTELLDRLRGLDAGGALRHLHLTLRDAGGRVLLEGGASPEQGLSWLDATRASAGRSVTMALPRPRGGPWEITLVPSPRSERTEVLASTAESAAVLTLLALGTLAAIAWSVRGALRPLGAMRHAIEGIEREDHDSLRRLPPMPVAELESIAAALRHMALALDDARARQRLLSQQVLSLQDDERQRIARELHDEFGQRLTAIRVDAAWLARRLQQMKGVEAGVGHVVAQIGQQCEHLQHDLRDLLARLRPLGSHGDAPTLRDVSQRLEALVAGWRRPAAALQVHLRFDVVNGDGERTDWAAAAPLKLEPALALAIYRISQEALTNVARHAQARSATLSLRAHVDGDTLRALEWAVEDDGVGIDNLEGAMRRGSGLAGLRERVWALGADLQCAPLHPDALQRRGLRLSARFVARPLAVA